MMPIYHRSISNHRLKKLNSRQRKKFHLGEFTCLDFSVKGALLPKFHNTKSTTLFMDNLIDFIENHKIHMGGSIHLENGDFELIFDHKRTLTLQDKDLIINWLMKRYDVAQLVSSDLFNAYYGDVSAYEIYPHIHK
ncbi:50S ribosome-binding protein YggL [Kingella negevensis]|uniref:50S ribosome-binding protein YggL n=1 Tax=Kingella negevensis TaxID=1522312 RepID=UPI00069459DC|nr:50S ribosome-binding protein YggL [Kingella negevensis]MDK4689492.1 50S ribosome-binding protein YggL [Kingella negevensis]WII90752.1 50S ribosome-binding protein YggL [Kingella negevensis]